MSRKKTSKFYTEGKGPDRTVHPLSNPTGINVKKTHSGSTSIMDQRMITRNCKYCGGSGVDPENMGPCPDCQSGALKRYGKIEGSSKEYGETVRITKGGAGSLLDPPNYPTHKYSAESRHSSQAITSLHKEAKKNKWTHILERTTPMMEEWERERLPESHPAVQSWIKTSYAYFHNCYSPDGKDRNVSNCVVDNNNKKPQSHHLAVLHIQKHYPSHKPNKDLIANPPSWGQSKYPKIVKKEPGKKKRSRKKEARVIKDPKVEEQRKAADQILSSKPTPQAFEKAKKLVNTGWIGDDDITKLSALGKINKEQRSELRKLHSNLYDI